MDEFFLAQVFLIIFGFLVLTYGVVRMASDYLIDGRMDHFMRWIEDISYGVLILVAVLLTSKTK